MLMRTTTTTTMMILSVLHQKSVRPFGRKKISFLRYIQFSFLTMNPSYILQTKILMMKLCLQKREFCSGLVHVRKKLEKQRRRLWEKWMILWWCVVASGKWWLRVAGTACWENCVIDCWTLATSVPFASLNGGVHQKSYQVYRYKITKVNVDLSWERRFCFLKLKFIPIPIYFDFQTIKININNFFNPIILNFFWCLTLKRANVKQHLNCYTVWHVFCLDINRKMYLTQNNFNIIGLKRLYLFIFKV